MTRLSIRRSVRTGRGESSRSSTCAPTTHVRQPIQPRKLVDAAGVQVALTEPGGANSIKGFHAVAARQQHSLETLKNSRQILFRSNFGLVRFERREGVLHAIHEMYTAARRPEETGTEPLLPETVRAARGRSVGARAHRGLKTGLVVDADEPEPA